MEFYRGQIVDVNLPHIGGSIQSGERPCVIIGNNTGNYYSPILIVIPLTSSTTKTKIPTHMWVEANDENGLEVNSMALAEQIMTITKTMVIKERGSIKVSELEELDEKIKISLALNK